MSKKNLQSINLFLRSLNSRSRNLFQYLRSNCFLYTDCFTLTSDNGNPSNGLLKREKYRHSFNYRVKFISLKWLVIGAHGFHAVCNDVRLDHPVAWHRSHVSVLPEQRERFDAALASI